MMPNQLTQGEFDYGQDALQRYPGFKRSYPTGVRVIDAGKDRINAAPQWTTNRVSEFYNVGDAGGQDMLPNPTDGTMPVIEIYNKDFTSSNPTNKKELIVGEMLHGMKNDPKWVGMRREFANSFTPDQVALQKKGMTDKRTDFYSETPGETHQQMMERSGTDAYIRAHFMPKQPGSSGWKSGYSPKQNEIIQRMDSYLKTDPAQSETRQAPTGTFPDYKPTASWQPPALKPPTVQYHNGEKVPFQKPADRGLFQLLQDFTEATKKINPQPSVIQVEGANG